MQFLITFNIIIHKISKLDSNFFFIIYLYVFYKYFEKFKYNNYCSYLGICEKIKSSNYYCFY